MVGRSISPFCGRLQSGFVTPELAIATSKVREYVKHRRLRLKRPSFRVLVESMLPVCDRVADCARVIAGQTPVGANSQGFMVSRFGESRFYLGRALQLQDGRLILAFGTKIFGTADGTLG